MVLKRIVRLLVKLSCFKSTCTQTIKKKKSVPPKFQYQEHALVSVIDNVRLFHSVCYLFRQDKTVLAQYTRPLQQASHLRLSINSGQDTVIAPNYWAIGF